MSDSGSERRQSSGAEASQNAGASGGPSDPQSTTADAEQTPTGEPNAQADEKPETAPERGVSQASHRTSEETETSDWGSSTYTLQTVSSSEMSPTTPSRFDPPTPKAMVFDVEDDLAAESILSAETPSTADISTARCADDTVAKSAEIPTTVA